MDVGMNTPHAQREEIARPAGAVNREIVQTTEMVMPHDRVSWGPVWAGLMTAFTVFLLLELLMYGLGAITAGSNGTGTPTQTGAWVTGIIGLIAFFLGGYVTEATSAVRGGSAGAINGFLVWALGISLILVLSILGLSQLFGAVGNVIGQFIASGHSINTPGTTVNGAQVAQVTQEGALGAFFTLLVSALAAICGGLAGSQGRAIGRLRTR